MWILAVDTSTRGGSAAIARHGEVVASLEGDPERTHGERLPNDLVELAKEAGVALADIESYAVAIGPGSFTSLRIGIATVQALALVRGRRVVSLSTLDILARVAAGLRPNADAPDARRILAWMDGQRREIFGGVYSADGQMAFDEPRVGPAEFLLDGWAEALADRPVTVIGDGIRFTRELLTARLGARATLTDAPPLAPAMIRLAVERQDRAVEPHAIQPLYVRRPHAVLARTRPSAHSG